MVDSNRTKRSVRAGDERIDEVDYRPCGIERKEAQAIIPRAAVLAAARQGEWANTPHVRDVERNRGSKQRAGEDKIPHLLISPSLIC